MTNRAVIFFLAILVILLSYGPTREAAAGFLKVFRAERVQVVSLSADDIKAIEQALKQSGTADLKEFGTLTVSAKPEERSIQPADASALAGFPARIPATLSGGYQLKQVTLTNGVNTSVTPNVQNLNKALASMGTNAPLPEQLTGKTFTIKAPPILKATYASEAATVSLVQASSPELSVPDGVDVEAIRKSVLAIPALPAQVKQALSMRDWQRTVLVPAVSGSAQEVSVNGQTGAFIASRDGSQSVMFWQQNGIWFGLAGRMTLAQAQAMALGLK